VIRYEDYDLPCNLLATNDSVEPLAFFRSKFEYAPRQRETFKGFAVGGFSIIIPHYDLDEWKLFWSDLNNGTDRFNASFLLHGSDNIDKVVRFTDTYALANLGALKFRVTCNLEILSDGTARNACPSYPSESAYPSNASYPC